MQGYFPSRGSYSKLSVLDIILWHVLRNISVGSLSDSCMCRLSTTLSCVLAISSKLQAPCATAIRYIYIDRWHGSLSLALTTNQYHSTHPMSNHAVSPRASTPLVRKEALQAEMTLKGHEDWVRDIAYIPGTRLLVTCSDDKSLRLWNLDTGQQVGKPLLGHSDYVLRVAVSPDGRWIVSGARDGGILAWVCSCVHLGARRSLMHFNLCFDIIYTCADL
ncbi:WD40-repeat-containing domain protein [Suillus subluteus]|nr:WD40-repeat-containing domain protein [Suillus subluteus]